MEEPEQPSGRDASRFIGGFIVGGIIGSLLTLTVLGSKDEKLKKENKKKIRLLVKELPNLIDELEEKGEEVAAQATKMLSGGKKKGAKRV